MLRDDRVPQKRTCRYYKQYGTGVRPSYVSADIADADLQIAMYYAAAEELGHKFED